MSPDFVSVIGALLPIALCGRSSLEYLRQVREMLTFTTLAANQERKSA